MNRIDTYNIWCERNQLRIFSVDCGVILSPAFRNIRLVNYLRPNAEYSRKISFQLKWFCATKFNSLEIELG